MLGSFEDCAPSEVITPLNIECQPGFSSEFQRISVVRIYVATAFGFDWLSGRGAKLEACIKDAAPTAQLASIEHSEHG